VKAHFRIGHGAFVISSSSPNTVRLTKLSVEASRGKREAGVEKLLNNNSLSSPASPAPPASRAYPNRIASSPSPQSILDTNHPEFFWRLEDVLKVLGEYNETVGELI